MRSASLSFAPTLATEGRSFSRILALLEGNFGEFRLLALALRMRIGGTYLRPDVSSIHQNHSRSCRSTRPAMAE